MHPGDRASSPPPPLNPPLCRVITKTASVHVFWFSVIAETWAAFKARQIKYEDVKQALEHICWCYVRVKIRGEMRWERRCYGRCVGEVMRIIFCSLQQPVQQYVNRQCTAVTLCATGNIQTVDRNALAWLLPPWVAVVYTWLIMSWRRTTFFHRFSIDERYNNVNYEQIAHSKSPPWTRTDSLFVHFFLD